MGLPQAEVIPLPKTQEILCCPSCKKPVEARQYMNAAIVGGLKSVLPTINCRCGYYGLPIQLKMKDYEQWLREG